MSKWIPGVALIGLICVMSIPAPGIVGLAIGCCCVLAIAVSVFLLVVDRFVSRFIDPMIAAIRRSRVSGKRRRAMHAGSGMVRKV